MVLLLMVFTIFKIAYASVASSASASASIVVFSRFSDLQGIYAETQPYKDFPAYSKGDMTLWHKATKNTRTWIFSQGRPGSVKYALRIRDRAEVAEEIKPHHLGDDIDRIVLLSNLVPDDYSGAPDAVVVESEYRNLDGIYNKEAETHMHFPIYHNSESNLYLWHEIFQNEWICSETVGGNSYMWKVPSSNPRASSPATSDVSKIKGDSKITAIRNVDPSRLHPLAFSRIPNTIVIFSQYTNRRGIYSRLSTEYEGFPVYQNRDDPVFLWRDLGGRWVCSEGIGSYDLMMWRIKSDAHSPEAIIQSDIDAVPDINRIVALDMITPSEDIDKAPVAIVIRSGFENVPGVYSRQKDLFLRFPVYYSKQTKFYIWHDLWHARWVSSTEIGKGQWAWWIPSGTPSLSPITADVTKVQGSIRIDKIEALKDVTPVDLMPAPVAVVVESGYANLDGVYKRQSKLHMYFPVYRDEKSSLSLWHHLFHNEWICSEVVDGDKYMWKIPASDPQALSPSHSDVKLIVGESKIFDIRDISERSARPVALSSVPKAIVVFSKYANRRGFYDLQSSPHEGFPVYTDAEADLSIWHDLGGRWVCSTVVGGNLQRAWRIKSDARSPESIQKEELETVPNIERIASLADVTPAQGLDQAPDAIVIKSSYQDVPGIYRHQVEPFLRFPVFYCKETKLFVWYELWKQRWLSTTKLGGGSLLWSVEHEKPDLSPIEVDIAKIEGKVGVDIIIKLNDLVPRDLTSAPDAIIVESTYANLDGVYKRQSEPHMYFPVYFDPKAMLYLWHDLFRNEWTCSEELDTLKYMWRIPASDLHALSPSSSDLGEISGDSAITSISDTDLNSVHHTATARMPKEIVVFSMYSNRRGIFTRLQSLYEGFPAYTDPEGGFSLWHDLGGRWVCSDGVGVDAQRAWRIKSNARSPDLIAQKEIDSLKHIDRIVSMAEVGPYLNLDQAPAAIVIKSPFTNIAGVYAKQENPCLGYPVYYSERTEFYIWYELWKERWVSSTELAKGNIAWWLPSDTRALSPSTNDVSQIQGNNVQITGISDETWTWSGKLDPKYVREDRLFIDTVHLPPTAESIGQLTRDPGADIEWIRAMDINRDHEDHLWLDITPNDMLQGTLGDCWLIAGFSGLAQYPYLIENIFVTKALSSEGQYKLRFWDVRTGEWGVITIDDLIPCKQRPEFQRHAEPLFVRTRHDGELWPLLLEKGFAAFVGSYAQLIAGEPSFAWQALTGCSLMSFSRESIIATDWKVAFNDVEYQRVNMVNETTSRRKMGYKSWSKLRLSGEKLFTSMERLNRKGQVMTAVIDKKVMEDMDSEISGVGLESDHAFTVLEVLELESFGLVHRLVCLRNPWGNVKSWLGAWGKDSAEWERYPEMTRRIDELFGGRRTDDDGVFWMSWLDFLKWFTTIDASTNIPPKEGTHAIDPEGDLPDAIAVMSRFINRHSVYEIRKQFAFPVYEAMSETVNPESRFLWYDYNSLIWVCSATAGTFTRIAWAMWSSSHYPTSLKIAKIDGIDNIVELSDIVPNNVEEAPKAVIVESEYTNIDGVYRREPKLHMYFPVYHNSGTGMYWWHNLFRNEWFCSQTVGGSRYMWSLPSSSVKALSPSTNDVHTVDSDNKIAIRDADPRGKRVVDLVKMPKAVVIFSQYLNRRGIYTRSSSAYEGFPTYTDSKGGLSLWHDLGGRWVCSSKIGTDEHKAWRVKSDAKSPEQIKQKHIDSVDSIDRIVSISDVAPADLNEAPGAIKVESVYSNVKGTFTLQCGHYLHYPVYYCQKTEYYLWHDLWHRRWVSSSEIGGNQYLWRLKSTKRSLSPTTLDMLTHGVDGDVGITKITAVVKNTRVKFAPQSPKALRQAVDKCIKQTPSGDCASSDWGVVDLT